MSKALNTLVLVPARMASTRLPNKPLAEIEGLPMVVQVVRRGEEAGLGPVVVAAAEPEIVAAVEAAGGRAILTDPAHPSGSDRIFEALNRLDPEGKVEAIINLQGDLPAIEPSTIKAALEPLQDESVDIATLATPIKEAREINDPNVVKAVVSFQPNARIGRALYFTRATAPSGEGPLLHHIGLYAYRRKALARFVKLPPSPLEKRERLEQLRALEAGMRIDVALVDTLPLGVDTPEDLERIRALMRGRSQRASAT